MPTRRQHTTDIPRVLKLSLTSRPYLHAGVDAHAYKSPFLDGSTLDASIISRYSRFRRTAPEQPTPKHVHTYIRPYLHDIMTVTVIVIVAVTVTDCDCNCDHNHDRCGRDLNLFERLQRRRNPQVAVHLQEP
jgi:hypothetical protein